MPKFKCEHFKCSRSTDNNYRRNKDEALDWPNPEMPISLCHICARKRKPLTPVELKRIMNKIFPQKLSA